VFARVVSLRDASASHSSAPLVLSSTERTAEELAAEPFLGSESIELVEAAYRLEDGRLTSNTDFWWWPIAAFWSPGRRSVRSSTRRIVKSAVHSGPCSHGTVLPFGTLNHRGGDSRAESSAGRHDGFVPGNAPHKLFQIATLAGDCRACDEAFLSANVAPYLAGA
jgi:hypothetical protein